MFFFFFFSSRRRHTRSLRDWSSDVCSSDLARRTRVLRLREVQDHEPSGALLVGRRIACYLAFMRHPKDQVPLARLEAEEERWRKEELAQAVAKSPLRSAEFHTDSGIPVPDLLTPADVGSPSAEDVEKYERDVGFPGRFPYTRGPQPTMYRGRLWTMRQFAGFGSPEDTNQRFKYL